MTLIQENTAMTILDPISTFTGEVLVFKLLGRLFYEYPDPTWIQYLANEHIFDEIPFGAGQPAMLTGLALLQQWSRGEQETIDDLRADYTRLFIGPAKVFAYPWESVYFSDERLTFQTETLQVRNWYRRFGLATADLYREPDDHVGLELDFISHLAQLGLTAAEENETARMDEVLDAQRQFFTIHAARWIPILCDLTITHARTDFYRGVAWVTKGALTELARQLGVPLTVEVKK